MLWPTALRPKPTPPWCSFYLSPPRDHSAQPSLPLTVPVTHSNPGAPALCRCDKHSQVSLFYSIWNSGWVPISLPHEGLANRGSSLGLPTTSNVFQSTEKSLSPSSQSEFLLLEKSTLFLQKPEVRVTPAPSYLHRTGQVSFGSASQGPLPDTLASRVP